MKSLTNNMSRYNNNLTDYAPKQLATYIQDVWERFIEIERRIFLKYLSWNKTKKLLRKEMEAKIR